MYMLSGAPCALPQAYSFVIRCSVCTAPSICIRYEVLHVHCPKHIHVIRRSMCTARSTYTLSGASCTLPQVYTFVIRRSMCTVPSIYMLSVAPCALPQAYTCYQLLIVHCPKHVHASGMPAQCISHACIHFPTRLARILFSEASSALALKLQAHS